jgi:heme-degrading monooxygenase HmoA
MILEVATLNVKTGQEAAFEAAFARAQGIIRSMKGYRAHQLQKCVEHPNRYMLFVQWETLEDHTQGFRESPAYRDWKELLHHFYDPFPRVEHYEMVYSSSCGKPPR